MADHVHMMIAIPPKYAVSHVIGYIKGKSAIHLARVYGENRRNFVGQHFWARGYFVSTVGRDETVIRWMPSSASSRVVPWLTHPGIDGHSTIHTPSSSRSIVTLNLMFRSPWRLTSF